MATTETIIVELADGGTITLTIEADFLAMRVEDFSLVKELAELVRNIGGTSPPAPPKNVGGRPRAALPPDEALEARRASDRERKKNQRHDIKAPPKPGAGGTSKYDYAEVALIAVAAQRAGMSYVEAIASKYKVGNPMASWLVKEARNRGFDIPKTRLKAQPTNVTPLLPVADIETVNHPAAGRPGPTSGARAFTPDDTLGILEGE